MLSRHRVVCGYRHFCVNVQRLSTRRIGFCRESIPVSCASERGRASSTSTSSPSLRAAGARRSRQRLAVLAAHFDRDRHLVAPAGVAL